MLVRVLEEEWVPSRVVTGLNCSARLGEVDFDVATFSDASLGCSFGL